MADTTVVLETTTTTVVTETVVPSIIVSAEQGPPGISASTSTTVTAGENLSGGTPVVLVNGKAYKAINTAVNQANKIIGVTTGSILANNSGLVTCYGELGGFAGLTPESPIYVSEIGTLVSTLPTSGYIQQIGIALTATTILINIQPSLILG